MSYPKKFLIFISFICVPFNSFAKTVKKYVSENGIMQLKEVEEAENIEDINKRLQELFQKSLERQQKMENKAKETKEEITKPTTKSSKKKDKFIYKEEKINGWTILSIGEELKEDDVLRKQAIKAVKEQLEKVGSRVPYKAQRALKRIPIYIYYDKPIEIDALAYYSPSQKAITFPNAKVLAGLKEYKNAVLLHEIAHAYHHIILGYENQEIKEAYENAKKEDLYKNVKTRHGNKADEAYALTNEKEYFAELTETYFSKNTGKFRNNYYPFTKFDLKKYDRKGYNMVSKLWNLR